MAIDKKYKNGLTERPVELIENDCLDAHIRISDNIFTFINNVSLKQATIAITGEWGIGKSSVINFLSENIKKEKNKILIRFEPLLEGKLNLLDIIGLFYLQLYKNIGRVTSYKLAKKSPN